ncbi:hypothetical protein C1H46_029245 [Malus baccata]|uniref:Clathrin/coatomer adaptor adaptin-like N-terminal domain-containing protein n=1 Tax=Malus baccata TaxID=106549 RepID=A0A540LFA5_MALBA|nr:hypothetical protein C1H46_029245 [Malus baccata]
MFSLHGTENSRSEKYCSDNNSALDDNGDMNDLYESELTNAVSRCYIEGPAEYLSRLSFMNKDSSEFSCACFTSGKNNDDVKILLQCTSPLLWSNNSAVVLAAAGVHWIMAPVEDLKRIVKPLLFVLRSSNASKYVVLCNIQVLAKAIPSLFSPYFEDFFICSSDSYQIKALKLDMLAYIATDSSISFILKEFQDYIRDPDRRFAADTVARIGICAPRLPEMSNPCLEFLLALTRQRLLTPIYGEDAEVDILIQAIMSIKSIIQQGPPSHEKVPAARAMVVWMVGEYNSLGDLIPRMLATVLKYLARCFDSEEVETKLQICNTAVKVLSGTKGNDLLTIKMVLIYVLELAKCDLNYDIVLHVAPGYEPLPKPCSLHSDGPKVNEFGEVVTNGDQYVTEYVTDDEDSASESLDEEVASSYSSQRSNVDSSGSDGSEEAGSASEEDEEITSLEPGQTMTRRIQVRFHHHLLPLKLTLYCNGKKHPIKLRPDIGYFVKALPMDVEAFTNKESQLCGMFECVRRCTFTDHIKELDKDNSLVEDKFLVICQSLALKMLSNANLHLVSVDLPVAAKLDDATGLCLRFSSKILSTCPLLDNRYCQRIVNFSVEPSHAHR